MEKLKQLIYEMLSTKTGGQLCDSGGAYGYQWQRNQSKTLQDWENEPAVSFDVNTRERADGTKYTEYDYTINVFHYLTRGHLELDEYCDDFNEMECTNRDSDEAYGISVQQEKRLKIQGFEFGKSWNTYNGDSSLGQILQGTPVELDGDHYILLQIHQGCDARGGYTDAKLFFLPEGYMPGEDIYGEVDGKQVNNSYDGIRLRYAEGDDEDKEIEVNENSKGELYLSEY